MNQTAKKVRHPHAAEVGEFATTEALLSAGGIFYTIPDSEDGPEMIMCDTPTATWRLFSSDDPGYQRVE